MYRVIVEKDGEMLMDVSGLEFRSTQRFEIARDPDPSEGMWPTGAMALVVALYSPRSVDEGEILEPVEMPTLPEL